MNANQQSNKNNGLYWCNRFLQENPCVKIEQDFDTFDEFIDILLENNNNHFDEFYKFLVKTQKERQ